MVRCDACDRYWRILKNLFSELGYRDHLGALKRFRAEHPLEVELLSMFAYLIDYRFAGRLSRLRPAPPMPASKLEPAR
jgi:hypothetical protein